MKIVLIFAGWTHEYKVFSYFGRKVGCYPPLNLALLAGIAENKGHEVFIIDGEVDRLSRKEIIDKISEIKPDVIGLTATTTFFHITCELAKEIKLRFDLPILIGGRHITVLNVQEFKEYFDYGFVGEAEKSWSKFLDVFPCCTDKLLDIKGLIFRHNGIITFTGQPEIAYNLDSLPFPARHLLKTNKYVLGTPQGRKNFTSIMATRGCPFKCIFCNSDKFAVKLRIRSPKLVVDEIEMSMSQFDIRHFSFIDDTVTFQKSNIIGICDEIKKRNLNITFEAASCAHFIDEEIISAMKNAGLVRLYFGLESVDLQIRKTIKKPSPLNSYKIANDLAEKYGVETLNSCMIGLPGETTETIRALLRYLRIMKNIKLVTLTIAVPYPGTKLYEMAKNNQYNLKLINDDWAEFHRYGRSVMQVGDLSPEELIRIQNEAYVSIYLPYWRWIPMIRKTGILSIFFLFLRICKCLKSGKIQFITNKQLKLEEGI